MSMLCPLTTLRYLHFSLNAFKVENVSMTSHLHKLEEHFLFFFVISNKINHIFYPFHQVLNFLVLHFRFSLQLLWLYNHDSSFKTQLFHRRLKQLCLSLSDIHDLTKLFLGKDKAPITDKSLLISLKFGWNLQFRLIHHLFWLRHNEVSMHTLRENLG